jgi:hypothetical protein
MFLERGGGGSLASTSFVLAT